VKRPPRDHLRAVLRIARWEVERSAGVVDRRTAAVGLLAVLLAGGVVAAGAAAGGGAAIDRDIYRVGVAPDSPYREPVERSVALDARPAEPEAFRDGDVEVLVRDGRVLAANSPKARAAAAEFRSAVRAHNVGLMRAEENGSAAFPVVVVVEYASRSAALPDAVTADGDGGGTVGGDSGAGGGGADVTDGDAATGDGSGAGTGGAAGPLGVPALEGLDPLSGGGSGSPAEIQPPFPFASLVLAFAFLVPMNFVIQAYGATMLNERINRRGELLLVAPVSPGDIVAGKTLPYLGLLVALTTLVAVAVGGSPVAVVAAVPIALLFLAATFAGAMFARSFKELTFVTVTISVFLTAYTFVPAIFANVTPIALISPLTVVVRDLQPLQSVSVGQIAFATAPFVLCAVVLFLLGIGIYREEDLFTQRPVPLKLLDALAVRVARPRDAAVVAGLSVPFVFVAELLAVAVLFALPVSVTVPLLLLAVAVVEEIAKSLHVFAAFEGDRIPSTRRTALVFGGLAGLGFFVGEKFTAVVQVVGLPELVVGRAAFAPAGIGVTTGVALFLAPLALHVVTTGLAALGARRSLRWYAAALVGSVGLHAAYNLTVVTRLA
jgi:ABC-type Na+ efflux pump permease subunit